jgi:hypothetical protein
LKAAAASIVPTAMAVFTPTDRAAMVALLSETAPLPESAQTRRDHVEHCFWQIVRLARHLAQSSVGVPPPQVAPTEFVKSVTRVAQLGLNLGRAQELLGSHGGVEAWWRAFKPLIEASDWAAVQAVALEYLAFLELPAPSVDFCRRE